ncbi:hypothetical protein A2291_07765 [candidate division WOR-1 bacterium RIFOXYB2_FULL_42_35]|uniref:DUF559 domain-containing protein n=1 Tax=candidate division WOR-1 bacterium RIFOXYC2_FULL_41_25 TaxID=1802586 RepID=A0A1F4TJ44_UNCSA|nr:MAG: hypothetical protein A2247_08290 [candidate division WOR-1 bacterium RIFOXYA2_FULL_41_14]OGC21818.1 MAG: hypothetical protein A2291_07765 [candidate division WOR-1 bacterium RIFOXYB2_FULL_42_35]OGC32716.1 MAG: hypothetical protein A2462_04155 [candidate division WOR-1 bacterium RIFOXYC2_FULL_41_25]OGC44032.1 MAG: hypothetical protein A2548_00315 [candidate division WOR-1 bacterium RIFOXYD2_FULL_41_8]
MKENLKNLIKVTVRNLRKNQTKAEAKLWEALRGRQLQGKKFLRQFPIVFKWQNRERFIIADFYCHGAKLVVELDGGIHEQQKEYDELRDYVLKSLGLKVLRITNETIENDFEKALALIAFQLEK